VPDLGALLDAIDGKEHKADPVAEKWDESAANALLSEYTKIMGGLPVGTITWAGDVGLYPVEVEAAIDEAANCKDLGGLKRAVSDFEEAAKKVVAEKKRVQDVMSQALTGTLRGSHRLPVRSGQREILGEVLLIVETQQQAEVISERGASNTTVFYHAEFADFLRALQAGNDVGRWMIAKRKFRGSTVQNK
jgi:hypothetical protein